MLFDEVHERSLDNDLALALALDAARRLRDDLRLLAMSATLDVDRFRRLLGDPPTIVSEGKSFPLDIRYVGRDAAARIEPQMASAIRAALGEHEGSLLAFLPGVAEIERTADALGALPADVELHKLHGGIEPAAQRKALAAAAAGQAQARPRDQHRRDQRHARGRADRRRQRPRPAAALRPRRRAHPPGHRARQPRRRDPARRPRGAPGARASLSACGKKRRPHRFRRTTRRKSSKPICRACC